MSLQTIDRQLHELGHSLSSVAERVEQLRGEIETSQAELDRLTEEDQQAATARRHLERELADGEAQIRNKRMRLNLVRNDKESARPLRSSRSRKTTSAWKVKCWPRCRPPSRVRRESRNLPNSSPPDALSSRRPRKRSRPRSRSQDVDSAPARRARPRPPRSTTCCCNATR